MGLMQIMPKTYAGLRVRHHLGPDAYDPHDNILTGAAYLREMLDCYGSPGFLAAYHAGPARYDKHLATGRPLPPETQVYIAMLSPMIGNRQSDNRTVASFDLIAWARATLFATHRIGCYECAAGSFAERPSRRRSLGALAAVGGSFRASGERGSSPMGKIAFHRTPAGSVARSAVGLSRWGGADHGRQDKSAAFGRAHVVGWIGDCRHLAHPTCWRLRSKRQRFQCSERHPGDQRRRPRA